MSTIWHDDAQPSFLGIAPRFSFFDIAEIVVHAPEQYEQARARLQAWERKLGCVFYQHNAELAYEFYRMKRPWYYIV